MDVNKAESKEAIDAFKATDLSYIDSTGGNGRNQYTNKEIWMFNLQNFGKQTIYIVFSFVHLSLLS